MILLENQLKQNIENQLSDFCLANVQFGDIQIPCLIDQPANSITYC
jgi:hypothetical protein